MCKKVFIDISIIWDQKKKLCLHGKVFCFIVVILILDKPLAKKNNTDMYI